MCEEIWKPIPGYEGLYDASSLGRIRSSPGKTTSSKRFPKRVWKSRIIKQKHPVSAKRQDYRVSLWKDGNQHDYLVSRLIGMAWYGIPPDGYTINHINGDWRDNRPENLEWCTQGENNAHGRRIGLFSEQEKQIGLIGNDLNVIKFCSQSEASRFLNRNNGYINLCLKRNKHIAKSADNKTYKIISIEKGAELYDPIGRCKQ